MQTKPNLSDAALRRLKATGTRHEITDHVVVGLRARISSEGRVTFILKARDAANRLQTVTLGAYPEVSLKDARERATRARLDLKAGKDINAEKRQKRVEAAHRSASLTLRELVAEYEARFATTKKIWAPRGPRSTLSGARGAIERVFAALMDKDVTAITEEDFSDAALGYRRARPSDGKTTANGHASRARAYLGPVLDWAAGRKRYAKIGASRTPRLTVASLMTTHDPASDDPSITGKRTRVLDEDELRAVLPLLTYPAPPLGDLRLAPERDFRPIALRFLLYTAARRSEISAMRWRDLDRRNHVWNKPSVKSTRGGPRRQALPLSDAAMGILRQLPGWAAGSPDDLVFPNGTGKGKLDNWDRFQQALHKASGTTGWQRHDLRRTAATIMHSLKVPASTIEQILAHADPLRGENVGASASHYLQLTRIMRNTRDAQEEALATLAEALALIEPGGDQAD